MGGCKRLPQENLREAGGGCGAAVVDAPLGSEFRMPVEFAVAAYRFGHSMIRNDYWVNFNFPTASMKQVFDSSESR